jgi:predicted RNA-binding Zn-ribbon protein involved in translation (DUF1610 family)
MVGKKEPRMSPNDAIKLFKDCVKMLQPSNSLRPALLLGAEAIGKMVLILARIPIGIKGDEYGCPNCGYDFPDIGGVNEACFESEQYKFCPECGQALRYDAPTGAESGGAND